MATHAQQVEPMVGGYGSIATNSKEAKAAAATAIAKHNATHKRDRVTLVKITKAEGQVVAGMNYRLCLRVKEPDGKKRNVNVVVWQKPRQKMRLTDWNEGGCS